MGFEEYVVDKLGEDYEEANEHKVFHCPFCYKNYDYKLYVNVSGGDRDGLWDCKRCGRVGNSVGFVMEYEGVGFREAKDILEEYGITGNQFYNQAKEEGLSDEEALYLMLITDSSKVEEEKAEVDKKPPPLPGGFKLIVDNIKHPEVIPFVDYIVNKRGIEPRMIPKHNIGYITKGNFTTSSGKSIPLYNHIVFLTYNSKGEYVYWNTRSVEENPYLKTINASGGDDEYGKSDTLFNFNTAMKKDKIVLTEGVFDALTVGDEGVSGFGKQYSKAQIDMIINNITQEQKVYILLDRDAITSKSAQGESSTLKMAEQLYSRHKETYIVIPETDEDPNDLGRNKVWDLIDNNAVKASPEGRLMVSIM